jgi:hypothetical protein
LGVGHIINFKDNFYRAMDYYYIHIYPKVVTEEYDDDNDRDMGNDDNVHRNANKGGRQFVVSCLSGRDYCG